MKWVKFRIILARVLFYQKKHPLHSFFGFLAISAALISFNFILAFEESKRQKVYQEITSLGPDYIRIDPYGQAKLTIADAEHLLNKSQNPSVQLLAPIKTGTSNLKAGPNEARVSTIWTSPEYALIHQLELSKGRYFNSNDMFDSTPVVVLGDTAKKQIIQGVFKKRQFVFVDGYPAYLIGVLDPANTRSVAHLENTAILPINSIAAPFSAGGHGIEDIALDYIEIQALKHQVDQAVRQITATLLAEHGEENFFLTTQESLTKELNDSTKEFRVLGLIFTLFSFIAAAFLISAQMLSYVNARSTEIAIRRISGLSPKDILKQFLAESLVLCAAFGIFAALASIVLINFIDDIYIGDERFVLSLRFYVPIASMIIALAIGMVGGLYSSLKASQIKILRILE